MKHVLQKSGKIACSGILMFSLLAASGSLLATGVQTARAEEIALARDIAQSNSFSQNAKLQSLVEGETAASASAGTDVAFDVARDYGGVYLDEDKILNVCLVENEYLESNRAYITDYLSEEQEVRIAPVRYSLQELNGLKEELEGQTESLSINGLGVSQTGNKVTVTLSDMAEEEELVAFSALAGYEAEMLSVKQGDAVKAQATKIYAGQPIGAKNPSTGVAYLGSIGAFAVYESDDGVKTFGLVTAGHCAVGGGEIYNIYSWNGNGTTGSFGTYIGATKTGLFSVSGTCEAAFVPFTSYVGWEITYQCYYKNANVEAYETIDDVAPCSMIIEGASVCKYGAITYATTGVILDTNWAGSLESVDDSVVDQCIKDAISLSCESASGDSGGCVFIPTYNAATRTYKNYIVGILSGGNTDESVCSKVINAQEILGIKIITKANYSTYCA